MHPFEDLWWQGFWSWLFFSVEYFAHHYRFLSCIPRHLGLLKGRFVFYTCLFWLFMMNCNGKAPPREWLHSWIALRVSAFICTGPSSLFWYFCWSLYAQYWNGFLDLTYVQLHCDRCSYPRWQHTLYLLAHAPQVCPVCSTGCSSLTEGFEAKELLLLM